MKNLVITLNIKANSKNEAEAIAMRELMQLAQATHCTMASGSGDAVYADGGYVVKSEMNMDGDVHAIHDMQERWLYSPTILSSAILVNEEKQPETEVKHDEPPKSRIHRPRQCECCGDLCADDHPVHRNDKDVLYLCDECWDAALDEGDVYYCESCENYVDVDCLVENPVTHKENICPCCGENINN